MWAVRAEEGEWARAFWWVVFASGRLANSYLYLYLYLSSRPLPVLSRKRCPFTI